MAIDLLSGVPGSGKSLLATYNGIEALLCHENVISNFPFDLSYFKKRRIGKFQYLPSEQITPKYLISWALDHHQRTGSKAKKAQTLVIIDEAEMIFNSRAWKDSSRMDWIYLFANHRHLNFDFILISQMDRMLDRQIRGQIQTEYKCRAITGFGLTGKILSLLSGGLFVAVPYNYAAHVKFLIPHFFRLHRKKAKVYDTMQLFKGMAGYDQLGGDGNGKPRRKIYGISSVSAPGVKTGN